MDKTKAIGKFVAAWVVLLVALSLCCFSRASADETAEALRAKAAALDATSQPSEAIAAWQSALDTRGNEGRDRAKAMVGIGRSYLALGQTDKAEQHLNGVLASYPDLQKECSQALLELGKISEGKQRYDEALSKYAELLERSSYTGQLCSDAKLRRAACYGALGKKPERLEELSGILKDYPDQPDRVAEARIRIAEIELAKGNTIRASVELRQVLKDCRDLDLWRTEALLWLAATERQNARLSGALTLYGGVIKDYRASRAQRLRAIVQRASILEQTGQRIRAVGEYCAILSGYSDFRAQADSAKERVIALLSAGKTPVVTARYVQRILARYDKLGGAAALDGDYQELAAKSGIDTAYARLVTEKAESLLNAGKGFQELGQPRQALGQYCNVRKIYPEAREQCFEAATARAQLLLSQKDYRAAVAELDDFATRSVFHGYWHARALNAKALLQYNARHYKDCAGTLRELPKRHSSWRTFRSDTDVKMLLAKALVEAGAGREAVATFQTMLAEPRWTRPDRALMYKYMGLASLADPAQSEKWFTQGISDFSDVPATADCYFYRAILRSKRRALAEALNDILLVGLPCRRHYALGEYYEAQGKKKEAASEFSAALPGLSAEFGTSYSQAYAAYDRLARFFEGLGDKEKATAAAANKQEIYRDHLAALP